jgi:hypothetical protein
MLKNKNKSCISFHSMRQKHCNQNKNDNLPWPGRLRSPRRITRKPRQDPSFNESCNDPLGHTPCFNLIFHFFFAGPFSKF